MGLDGAAVVAAATRAVARIPGGAVARLRLTGLAESLRGTLDQRAIKAAAAHALVFELKPEWEHDAQRVPGGVELRGLSVEFEEFAAHQVVEGVDRVRLLRMARDLLGEDA
jgi:hypothetical protein